PVPPCGPTERSRRRAGTRAATDQGIVSSSASSLRSGPERAVYSAFAIHAPLSFEPGASAMPPGKALKIGGMRSVRASTGTAVPTVTGLESLRSWSFWWQVVSDAGLGHHAVTTRHHEMASGLASSALCSRVRCRSQPRPQQTPLDLAQEFRNGVNSTWAGAGAVAWARAL